MEFNFSIKNDKLTSVAYPKGVTGNVNTYTCRFDIECDIAGLIWFCIFKQGDNVYNQIIEDNTCIMPYEVLTNAEPLYIGCYGTNADDDIKRVSTNFICFDVKQGAYSEADAPEIPTPDVWESLINKNVPYIGDNGNWFIYDIEQKKYIDSGYKSQGEKGDTGEQGLQGPKGDKGDTGYTPIKGVDYFTSEDIESLGIDQKQDKLTFDDIPTADSTNPVTSGGVKTALNDKLDTSDAVGKKTAEGGEIFNKYEEDPDGPKNIAGDCAHAEGYTTTASGVNSHAEGSKTIASGGNSHAEGSYTHATGASSHAEGDESEAKGENSHAEGFYTIASKKYQHVQGKFNIEDTATGDGYAHIVGNGSSSSPEDRSNAHTLDWNGNAWYKGDVKIGGTSYDDSAAKALATIDDVRPAVKNTIDTIAVNTIYDLGVQTELNITLPSGQIGDFIEFDFISGETATNLTVHSSSGLVGFDLIPETNTVYTLYFDWGETGLDGTSITYGWRCNYSEYSIVV